MNNFYIVNGNLKKIRAFLNKFGFLEAKGVLDENMAYVVIGTFKKVFWTIDKDGFRIAKNLITHQLRETYVIYSFEHFKKDFSLSITENFSDLELDT